MHDYRSVIADIRACRRITSKWIAGHDYHMPDVQVAVAMELGKSPRVFSDYSWLVPVDD